MPLSAHKGAIRNKDPINPSDVSTGTAALGLLLMVDKNHVTVQVWYFFFFLFEVKTYLLFEGVSLPVNFWID